MMERKDKSSCPAGMRGATVVRVVIFLGCVLQFGCRKCDDYLLLEGPPELRRYMEPFKVGAWWAFANSAGEVDTLSLVAHEEGRLISDDRDNPCYATLDEEWSFSSSEPGSSCSFKLDYIVGDEGKNAVCGMLKPSSLSPFLSCGYYPDIGYSSCTTTDTLLNGLELFDVLHIKEATQTPECMWEMVLDSQIGIVAYAAATDTFNLVNYFIP